MTQRFVSIALILAALGLMAASAYINFRFGEEKFSGGVVADGKMFGAAAVAFDIFKALVPLGVAWAWAKGKYLYVLAGSAYIIFVVCLSFVATAGFIAEKRASYVSARQSSNDSYQEVATKLKETRSRVAKLDARPVGTVEAELDGKRQHKRWSSSKGCTDATATKSRTFCKEYKALEAELATAKTLDQERATVSGLSAKLQALRKSGGVKDKDPQLTLFKKLTGFDLSIMNIVMVLGMAAGLEFGSAFGLYFALNHGGFIPKPFKKPVPTGATKNRSQPVELKVEPPKQLPPPAKPVAQSSMDVLAEYALSRLERADNDAVEFDVVHADYCAWCNQKGHTAMSRRAFTTALLELAEHVNVEVGIVAKRKALLNMQMKRSSMVA